MKFFLATFVVLAAFAALPATAEEALMADSGFEALTDAAADLAAMINAARRDPLATAAALGRDPDQVLADLPELAGILTGGLAPLGIDAHLVRAAAAHAEDIFASGSYSSTSVDGTTVEERLAAAGYDPGAAGESIGFLGFQNYVSAHAAVEKIFTKLFLDELNPATKMPRNILNAAFSDLGVSLASGRWLADGVDYNAYIVVCDFGSTSKRQVLLDMINQARRDPLGTAADLGMDPQKIVADFPYLEGLLRDGMAPVSLNGLLNTSAVLHTADMFARNYFSTLSPTEGSRCISGKVLPPPGGPWRPVACSYDTHWDRIRAVGYNPVEAGESLGILRFYGSVEADDALEQLFVSMFAAELDPQNTEKWNILDPKFEEVGIGDGVGPLSPGLTPAEPNAYLLTFDFGTSAP